MNLANTIVVDEEEQLVAKNRPANVPSELVSVEGIFGDVVRVKVKVVGIQGFVFIVLVDLAVKLVSPLLGHHRNCHLRTILGSNNRGVHLELLQSPNRGKVCLRDHFVRTHIGNVTASPLPRIAGADSVHREVA